MSAWEHLLSSAEERVLPFLGGRKVLGRERSFLVQGPLPPERGWYRFSTGGGRHATLIGPAEPDPGYGEGLPQLRGYLVGDRLVPDEIRPTRLAEETEPVFCLEPGLDRFTRITVARDLGGRLVFLRQELPEGPELEVQSAFLDRLPDLSHIPGVCPALDLAFRWCCRQRAEAEARRAAIARKQEQERELQALLREEERLSSQAAGRRQLARHDFATAARQALRVSGAELLDARPSWQPGEMVVQYRFRGQRLECVVDRATLQVIDAGICLTDHETGEQGDSYFTLESLPGVVGQALDEGRLVVWRHA